MKIVQYSALQEIAGVKHLCMLGVYILQLQKDI
jgi:hypothetical protein